MLTIATPRQCADSSIRKAAKIASIVFASEQWIYYLPKRGGGGVPDHIELEDTIRYLLRSIIENGNISTGRISVEKDELSGYTIHLEIGTLSQEELDSLDEVQKDLVKEILDGIDVE